MGLAACGHGGWVKQPLGGKAAGLWGGRAVKGKAPEAPQPSSPASGRATARRPPLEAAPHLINKHKQQLMKDPVPAGPAELAAGRGEGAAGMRVPPPRLAPSGTLATGGSLQTEES